ALADLLAGAEDPGNWDKARPLLGHARIVALGNLIVEESTLLARIGVYDHAIGDYANARRDRERLVALREETLERKHPETLSAMGTLAQTLYAQGELGPARTLQEEVLSLSREVCGDHHQAT